MLGAGRMGKKYLQVLAEEPGVKIAGIGVRTDGDSAKELAKAYAAPVRQLPDWGKLISEGEPDLVFISTSEWAHWEPFKLAAEAGVDIVLEKPISASAAEAKKMRELASRTGVRVQVCFTSRFLPKVAAARAMLAANNFGKLGYIYSRRNADAAIARRVLGKIPMPFWIACHDVDLIRYFSSAEIIGVRATLKESVSGGFLWAELYLSNGATGVIENSWMGESCSGLHLGRLDLQYEKSRVEIVLDGRGILIGGSGGQATTVDYEDQFRSPVGRWEGATPCMIRHFLRVKQGLEKPVSELEDGFRAAMVCAAMAESAHAGKKVELK